MSSFAGRGSVITGFAFSIPTSRQCNLWFRIARGGGLPEIDGRQRRFASGNAESGRLTAGGKCMNSKDEWVRVWDPFVRAFHWLLVVTFFVAYFTEDELMTLHAWAGYAVGALILFRIVWGFVGPKHARYSDFLYRPAVVKAYLRDLVAMKSKRYLGHTPPGGVMVVVLLIALAVTVWSGMEALAVDRGEGPLAGLHWSVVLPGAALASDDEHEGDEHDGGDELWEEVHEAVADLTLALVLIHVCGVLFTSYVHRENLVRSMVTGRKRAGPGDF